MKTTYVYKVVTTLIASALKKDYCFTFQGCDICLTTKLDKLNLTIPGSLQETSEKAFEIANYLEYVLSSSFGATELKRIEYKEIGEEGDEGTPKANCFTIGTDIRVRAQLNEEKLSNVDWNKQWAVKDAIAWFVEADRVSITILEYTCRYKVLEFLFDGGRSSGIRSALERMKVSNLQGIVTSYLAQNTGRYSYASADDMITDLVEKRDKCSHLQSSYGYSPVNQSDVQDVVQILLPLKEIAKMSIEDALA